jgi:hypothetical protein
MRHRKKASAVPVPIFLALVAFFCPVASAPSKSDSASQTSQTPAAKQSGLSPDTSLIIEDLTKKKIVPASGPVSTTASAAPVKDSLARGKDLTKTSVAKDTLQVNTTELFRNLGTFHKAMGIYMVAAGALAVIAGGAVLDKQDILPFSLSLITLGGITGGIGIWEISVGRTFPK